MTKPETRKDEWKDHTHLFGYPNYPSKVGDIFGDDPKTHLHQTAVGPTGPAWYEKDGAHYHVTVIGPTSIDQPIQKGTEDGVGENTRS